MLAERLSSMEEIMEKLGGECALEYKYDGLRIQAHITPDDVTLFSRRLENITDQFPDVRSALREAFTATDAIIEGECVPIDPSTGEFLPFQLISRRRGRKYGLSTDRKNYSLELGEDKESTLYIDDSGVEKDLPVALVLFDCLYLDGVDRTTDDFLVRKEALKSCLTPTDSVQLATYLITDDLAGAEGFFLQAIAGGTEGIIAKDIRSETIYRAGARGWQWIKLKRDYKSEMVDTVDLVIIGGFAGYGKRAGVYGAFLMAVHNTDTGQFQTVCKLGSGFSDEVLAQLRDALTPDRIDVAAPGVHSTMAVDYWFQPTIVLEVLGAEITLSPIHTCAFGTVKPGVGLAIRFPRYTGRVREDKRPEDATTAEEIVNMYKLQ